MAKFVKLKKIKRRRKHGFLTRRGSHDGQKIIKRRRNKKRLRLNV